MLLVVDDKPTSYRLLHDVFADLIIEVSTACDGKEAIAERNTEAICFRAFMTDLKLGKGPDG